MPTYDNGLVRTVNGNNTLIDGATIQTNPDNNAISLWGGHVAPGQQPPQVGGVYNLARRNAQGNIVAVANDQLLEADHGNGRYFFVPNP